jgi:hypothetical protein
LYRILLITTQNTHINIGKLIIILKEKNKNMKGIHYVTDDEDRKIAVQIDLKQHSELWEDFYDNLIAESRKDEEKIPLEDVIKDLKKAGKIPYIK